MKSGRANKAASIATLRTSGGPLCQPTHTGANQTTPARTARSPVRPPDPKKEVTRPAKINPTPTPTMRVAARAECPAYVVLRPGPMAMASEPSAEASAANPAASRDSRPRCIRTAATA